MSDSELEIFINKNVDTSDSTDKESEIINIATEEEIDSPPGRSQTMPAPRLCKCECGREFPDYLFQKADETNEEDEHHIITKEEIKIEENAKEEKTLTDDDDDIDWLLSVVEENNQRRINEKLEKLLYKVKEGDDDATIQQKAIYNSLIATNSEMLELESQRERELNNFPSICPKSVWDSW